MNRDKTYEVPAVQMMIQAAYAEQAMAEMLRCRETYGMVGAKYLHCDREATILVLHEKPRKVYPMCAALRGSQHQKPRRQKRRHHRAIDETRRPMIGFISPMKTALALTLLLAAGSAYATSPAKYRCAELSHAADGTRCATHPTRGILFFTISAPAGSKLREHAEVRLQEIFQQAAVEFRDRKLAPPAVFIRAIGPDGVYYDQRCMKPRECYGWEPRQASADKYFPK